MVVRRRNGLGQSGPSVRPGAIDAVLVPPVLAGRLPIMDVHPTVESGRLPAKAAVGEAIPVGATCFREGHDLIGVEAILLRPDGSEHSRTRLGVVGQGLDRWNGLLRPDAEGDWSFSIEAWDDPWATWLHRADIKIRARSDIDLEFTEGALVIERAAKELPRGKTAERKQLRSLIRLIRDADLPPDVRLLACHDEEVTEVLTTYPLRDLVTRSGPWPLRVERRRALVGSWYEFFPRSEGASLSPMRSGTFTTASGRLEAISKMGFDVVYLPPIHPIGHSHRKGPNNTLTPAPQDPGSPWAIGSAEGGHDAVHADLGDHADFAAFVRRARTLGMEIALDFALQAAPDHPWVHEHPEWFTPRADGTVAYAENPPKKYQDIYPLNFDRDPEGLYAEIFRLVTFWMSHGVRIFRVDNPHTKPLWVWERLLREIRQIDAGVIFLAEAFTRPPMMRALAEVGFQQSYTYFTWRNDREGLQEYFTELAGPAASYMRPNLFVNTPDILSEYLQHGGPPAFAIRASLAATLSPTWGVYSGFELFEATPLRSGSEEYLDSEKYQFRPRDWLQTPNLTDYITCLNEIRRAHPALQDLRSLRFHHSENDNVIAYSKVDGDDIVLIVCTLDPHHSQESMIWWDMPSLGLDWLDSFNAHDLVTDEAWTWTQSTYVRLDPKERVAHIISLRAH